MNKESKSKTTKALLKMSQANNDLITANELEVNGHSGEFERMMASQANAEAHDLLNVNVEHQDISVLGESIPTINYGDTTARLIAVNTLKNPKTANLEASNHRINLLAGNRYDITALALDTAESIQAENSLEKMLAHQMAMCHQTALKLMDQALEWEENAHPLNRNAQQATTEQVRLMKCSARIMDTFQRGMLTLQKIRTGGNQTMTVQHVHVESGGQALIGSVQGDVSKGGGKTKV
jgi:hypothetical protein